MLIHQIFCSYFDVHDVADFIHGHVCWKWNDAMFSVWTREQIAGATSISFRVGHFPSVLSCEWQLYSLNFSVKSLFW